VNEHEVAGAPAHAKQDGNSIWLPGGDGGLFLDKQESEIFLELSGGCSAQCMPGLDHSCAVA